MGTAPESEKPDPLALTTALRMLGRGLWPVALHPGLKRPIGESWGVNRPTPESLRALWAIDPATGVGIMLGKDAGVIDVEIDDPSGETTLEELFGGEVVETLGWTSRRGSHRLFRFDDRLAAFGKSILKVGAVEIRIGSLDGQAKQLQSACPPTETDGFRREWAGGPEIAALPDVFFDALGKLFKPAAKPGARPKTISIREYVAPQGGYLQRALEGEVYQVVMAPQGGRNEQLNRSAFNLGTLIGHGLDRETIIGNLTEAAMKAGLGEKETHDTIRSGLEAGEARPRENFSSIPGESAKEAKEAKKDPRRSGDHGRNGDHSSHNSLLSPVPLEIEENVAAREWPSPPDPAAFEGPAGRFARAVAPYTEADPLGILISALVGFGNILGRTVHWRVGATKHHCNLNVATVGKTAGGRKGTAWDETERLLQQVDAVWAAGCIGNGLSSGEGLISAVRDPSYKKVPLKSRGRIIDYQSEMIDEGVSDKRLLVVESELGRTFKVMGREGNSLSALIREAWDGKDLRTMTKVPVRATAPHISIIGHITEMELVRHLSDVEAANGFGNRFLWLMVRRAKLLPRPMPVPAELLASHANDLRAARDEVNARVMGAELVQMRRDSEAEDVWDEFYPRASAERMGLLGSMLARGAPTVMRLAMLYAVMDGSPVIGASHMHSSIALWDYAERSAAYIFGDSMGDPDADSILSALHAAPDGLTQSQISIDVFQRHRTARRIAATLGRLLECGLIASEKVPTDGRQKTLWRIAGAK